MRPEEEFWDLVVFVIVILGLATIFAFAGQKIDEFRQDTWEARP